MLPTEAANRLLDDYLQNGDSLYMGLLTTIPVKSDTESDLSEVSYTGYARVATTFNSTLWNNAADSAATNKAAITFPACTATATPREFTKGAFFVTASSGGVIVVVGRLLKPLEIVVGKQPIIPAGYLTVYAMFDASIG